MDQAGFTYADGAIEVIAYGVQPSEHETYLAWMMLVSDPVLDFNRTVRIRCAVPNHVRVSDGQAAQLDCQVELVLGKRYTEAIPHWVAGAYSGEVSATVRLTGQTFRVDLAATELPCIGGGIGPLRVSGCVVARRYEKGLDFDRELFLEDWQAAIGLPAPEPGHEQ